MSLASFAVTNATIVLPDEVLTRGSVVVRDGLIQSIHDGDLPSAAEVESVVDADGAHLLPGAIDLHNDSLEFEVNPRPGANLPLPFALSNLERRLVAAGVTTEFHAIAFMDRPSSHRAVTTAAERSAHIATLHQAAPRAVEHHVLHRIDVWHPEALDAVFQSLGMLPVRYASLNDHTPGQGQYRDMSKLIEYYRSKDRGDGAIERELYERMASRAADTETVPGVHRRIREEREQRPFILSTHDDDSVEKVDTQWAMGATVAEFPVTFEAAERARYLGMHIVVGAPNVIRGGSQSGNLPAHELIQRGLADVICADYHAPSLLPSAFRLMRDGLMDLPTAVRMVSANAAHAAGLTDRGAIQPGLRADLVIARLDSAGFPQVEATFLAGRPTFTFGRLAAFQPAVVAA
jgi:alpha-D-ribose 1-methylphosphonate 5-triphosphate diphosphatase